MNIKIAARIWILTSLFFGLAWLAASVVVDGFPPWFTAIFATIAAIIGSTPVLVVLLIALERIAKSPSLPGQKFNKLIIVCICCTVVYGIVFAIVALPLLWLREGLQEYFQYSGIATAILFACAITAVGLTRKQLDNFFGSGQPGLSSNQNHYMEPTSNSPVQGSNSNQTSKSNRIIIKASITGALILLMMIPTAFITSLVNERQARHQEVATEVSSKWAAAQTLSGPYIFVPYKVYDKDRDGNLIESENHFWILPDNLNVNGQIDHEVRTRSIYKVLLYKSSLQETGNFIFNIPNTIDRNTIKWSDIKICYGLSDFRGIEERLAIIFNGAEYELSPGLPAEDIGNRGLSVPVNLTSNDIGKNISFNGKVRIKGSDYLHFVPLAGNSQYTLTSTWPSPSFDGNSLPSERTVSTGGFDVKWSFNKANLPFGTMLKDFKFDQNSIVFGVTMLEPADQYAKTSRSVKYAILFIGLTFSLFFIIELMQKKPVHPVQYVLVGIALVVFYTLLLSISEFILFDLAYLIAAASTILLISFYAGNHFKSGKSAVMFGVVLSILYGFIFILIRLEDTALLVGSIGLFIVLALIMYASRKIDWYGSAANVQVS